MASSALYSLLIILFFLFPFLSESQATFKPTTLILPLRKDIKTNLHVTNIRQRTPLSPIPLVVDLNSQILWVDCEKNYSSSTYRTPSCNSTQCSRAGSHNCLKCSTTARPGCHNNTCGVPITNPLTHLIALGEVGLDVLSIQSTQGSNTGPFVVVPQFLFACAPSKLLRGARLPKNVQGFAGLGHNPIALPSQLASHFGFQPKFALCLSSSTYDNGVIFLGNGPYMLQDLDVSDQLGFTPLTVGPQGEYYIQVRSIRVNNKNVPFNTSSFSRNKQGPFIYATISTTAPHTVLEHSIFQAVTQFFASELQLWGVARVDPVAPFGMCFNSSTVSWSQMGPGVPAIDLVFPKSNVTWPIIGANSMVRASPEALCLGFVDGGLNPRTPIVIGSHQLENNLVLFDLARSRLGFSSLFLRHTNCVNFNFTTTP